MAYYYTRDHLGSVREMCSSTGTITSRMAYDSYGRTTTVSGTVLPTVQYAGYYQHEASGLALTKNRQYDSSTGRWLSRDPIAFTQDRIAEMLPDGANLYSYCVNEPVARTDKFGLASLKSCNDECNDKWPNSGARGVEAWRVTIPLGPLGSYTCHYCLCSCVGILAPGISSVPFNYHGIYLTECNYLFGSKYRTVVFEGAVTCPPEYSTSCAKVNAPTATYILDGNLQQKLKK